MHSDFLRRLRPYMKPYTWMFLFMIITTALPVAMELLVPRALRTVIDAGIEQNDMQAIWQGVSVMLAAALVGVAATLGQGVARARISQGLAYDLRDDLFAHIQAFSFANLDQMQAGQLMTRITSDVDMIRFFMSGGLALLLRALLMISGSLLMMFLIDWRLARLMLVILPLAALLIGGLMLLTRPLFTIVQQKLSLMNTAVQENLAGVALVKAYVRERYEMGRFQRASSAYMQEHIRVGRLSAIATPLLALLTNLAIVAIAWFGGLGVMNGRLSIGELVAFNSYLLIGMAPIMLLGNVLTMIARAQASADRVWQIFETPPALPTAAAAHTAGAVQGQVVFEEVSFHYEDGGAGAHGLTNEQGRTTRRGGGDVLQGVSFAAQPGQTIALLGATGSGKSSLVALIPRFYDALAGRVLVDGVDVRDWEPQALRRGIGVVQQDAILFSGTIAENIAYGRPQASMAEIMAAAQAAQAHDFISALPDGYESMVEERGANLSGGQKQRLAIARALLIKPGILILDDSTSAVDMDTEARIQEALAALMTASTTFIVAQRISSVLGADQILILENGRIAARGTHETLLAGSPLYREIVASQLGGDPAAAEAADGE